jgi:hypothetical protein
MEHSKLVFLLVLFCTAGITFIGTGVYLLSESSLNKFGNKRRLGKAAGWSSFSIGILTCFAGVCMYIVPSVVEVLLLVYLGLLFAIACAVMLFIKIKK